MVVVVVVVAVVVVVVVLLLLLLLLLLLPLLLLLLLLRLMIIMIIKHHANANISYRCSAKGTSKPDAVCHRHSHRIVCVDGCHNDTQARIASPRVHEHAHARDTWLDQSAWGIQGHTGAHGGHAGACDMWVYMGGAMMACGV